mgnify:CR=1 FL=1
MLRQFQLVRTLLETVNDKKIFLRHLSNDLTRNFHVSFEIFVPIINLVYNLCPNAVQFSVYLCHSKLKISSLI